MKPEKQNLIDDLMGEDSSREKVLQAGGMVLRRRRHWRAIRRSAAVLTLVVVVTLFLFRKQTPPLSPVAVVNVVPKASPTLQVHALSDDELLALFPGTPVGLASTSDGKKRLIFPRPGDEQRFITRL